MTCTVLANRQQIVRPAVLSAEDTMAGGPGPRQAELEQGNYIARHTTGVKGIYFWLHSY